jgi:hypothetical protein
MANTLGYYDPLFYAQEALIHLEKALGMAARVHRGYDEERRSFNKGEYINIRKPSKFTVQNAPGTAEDLAVESVQLQLAHWREVKFALTDKELAFTTEKIIEDHIRPAAYALADDIDQKLVALYKDIPWYYDLAANGSTEVGDITGVRKVQFQNAVPLQDIGNVHYMVDGNLEKGLLDLAAFTQQQGAGDQGVQSQRRGSLGTKYGYEIFANQNVPLHQAGTFSCAAPKLKGAHSKGATSVTIDHSSSLTGTLLAGDSLVLAGNTQRYSVTADASASSNEITVSITPALIADYTDNATATVRADTHRANLAFHRNAFALAMAPLSEIGNELGARIASITDPITGLSLRSRLYYIGNSSVVHVALDALYGIKTLDPNLACRGCGQN